MIFKLGEMFCGPGGIAKGARESQFSNNGEVFGFEHGWANDYHSDTCDTYSLNIAGHKNSETVICKDVRELDVNKLPHIDAFAYGFPCNDFSIVGEHKGFDGEFGPLYTYGIKVINIFRPKFFLAENVSGITSANSGEAFQRILSDLQTSGNGYDLTVHLYKSEQYGVPQTRHRIIIVGIDKTLGLKFNVPAPTTPDTPRTARWALENPPIPKNAPNQKLTRQSETVVARLKHIKPGENAWTADLPEHLQLNVKGAKLSQIYRRLHPDKPSYTITGSGGGGTHGYHWSEPRALTNRERARIQTFPDDFAFCGAKESVRKQIGMAVPPLLAKEIFTAVLKTFAGIHYPSVPSNQSKYVPSTQLTLL